MQSARNSNFRDFCTFRHILFCPQWLMLGVDLGAFGGMRRRPLPCGESYITGNEQAPNIMNFKVLLLVLCFATSAHARESFAGQVSYVTDGDTLWVQPDGAGKAIKVRIEGIDAPEICQPGGPAARDLLAQLALHRRVTARVAQHDQWGRALGTLTLDGKDLGAQMVRAGQAWSYSWRRKPGPYAAEEALARQAHLGVFAAARPESPRAFRKRHGSCHSAKP